jgi:hypothetical protein
MSRKKFDQPTNYRVVIEYIKGGLYDGKGWAKDLEDARRMFNSVMSQLTRKKISKAELYFENRLIKKL